MEDMQKKSDTAGEREAWEKPQLVVLARGKPEEAVLGICKGTIWGGPSSTPCPDVVACYDLITT